MRVLCLLVLGALVGCALPATHAVPASHSAIALPGVQLTPPADQEWIHSGSPDEPVFSRVSAQVSARLSARVLQADSSTDERAFLRAAEARQEETVAALEMISVHYNRARLSDATCLQYDGIYHDSTATDAARRFLTRKGYVCRHPAAATRVLHMELTLHSASRSISGGEPLMSQADAFFHSARFSAPTGTP